MAIAFLLPSLFCFLTKGEDQLVKRRKRETERERERERKAAKQHIHSTTTPPFTHTLPPLQPTKRCMRFRKKPYFSPLQTKRKRDYKPTCSSPLTVYETTQRLTQTTKTYPTPQTNAHYVTRKHAPPLFASTHSRPLPFSHETSTTASSPTPFNFSTRHISPPYQRKAVRKATKTKETLVNNYRSSPILPCSVIISLILPPLTR